jgi:hypothetical protein
MLGLRSAKGTSTVILTRVGLNCSTVLGTLVTPDNRGAGRSERPPRWLTLSRGNPTRLAQADQTSIRRFPGNRICRQAGVSYTRPRTFGRAERPGRSVAASASALGAEDRRFESCRPDSVIHRRPPVPQDHHGHAGVAQWQSSSLPSWSCEFDSRHPLHIIAPSQGTLNVA